MLSPLQIVLLIFITFALSRAVLRLRERVIPLRTAVFWSVLWIGAFAGILAPQTTTRLASYFGVGRGVDVIVYLSLALLFYLVFRIYVMIEDLRHEITDIIRTIALQKSSKAKKRSIK